MFQESDFYMNPGMDVADPAGAYATMKVEDHLNWPFDLPTQYENLAPDYNHFSAAESHYSHVPAQELRHSISWSEEDPNGKSRTSHGHHLSEVSEISDNSLGSDVSYFSAESHTPTIPTTAQGSFSPAIISPDCYGGTNAAETAHRQQQQHQLHQRHQQPENQLHHPSQQHQTQYNWSHHSNNLLLSPVEFKNAQISTCTPTTMSMIMPMGHLTTAGNSLVGDQLLSPPAQFGTGAYGNIHAGRTYSLVRDNHYDIPAMTPQSEDDLTMLNSQAPPEILSAAVENMIPSSATTHNDLNKATTPPGIADADDARGETYRREILRKCVCSKWVKLTRMSPGRTERIRGLAKAKNIDMETVNNVLALYTQNKSRGDTKINRFEGDDVYIKITMGSGSTGISMDSDFEINEQSYTKKKHRKKRPDHVKRPLNSFMLYRKSQTQSAMAFAVNSQLKLNHQNISQIIGLMWQTESKELKDEFANFARQEKEVHRALHPDYKFCPQKKAKR